MKLTESQFKRIVNESVKKILKEEFGYDINEESIRDQAITVITQMEKEGTPIQWRTVAERMGFPLETLSPDDMEAMKSGIEMAMLDCDYDNWEDDADFELSMKKFN